MNKIDLKKYDVKMIQMGINFCISACVESMLRYLAKHIPYARFPFVNVSLVQEYIMGLMVMNTSDHLPSFGAIRDHVACKCCRF